MECNRDILECIMADTIGNPGQVMSIAIPEEKRRRNFRSQSEMKEGHGCVEGIITIDPPPSGTKVILKITSKAYIFQTKHF